MTKTTESGLRQITPALLRQHGASARQISLFVTFWGDHLELTEALCLEQAEKFDWDLAARQLLPLAALAKYLRVEQLALEDYLCIQQAARAQYDRARQAALAKYKAIEPSTFVEYMRIQLEALAEYKRAEQCALAEYNQAEKVAWAEYKRLRASSFFHAWTSPENQAVREIA